MNQPVTLTAPLLICPDDGAIYSLNGRAYTLMNGKACCTAHLVNFGAAPAMVAGSIAGAAGALVVEPGAAFMLGWSPRDRVWRALRMVGAQIAGAEGIPSDARLFALPTAGSQPLPPEVQQHLAPVPATAAFMVESLDGTAARATLPAIAAYLAGAVPSLTALQSSPAVVV